jgi:predicted nucleic acid-binding protein
MVILDSSFLLAYYNARDRHHAAAARAMVQLLAGTWGGGVVLEYVLLEVVTVLRVRRGVDAAATVGATLLGARELRFLPCSDLFTEAWSVFRGQGQRGALSLADAAIVVAARRDASGLILTFDADFRAVAGITVLPA